MQVNAYVTPPSSRGFSAHYDIHDVFVLQVAGEKRWIVHEPVLRGARSGRSPGPSGARRSSGRSPSTEPILDVVLRPGDALYLPRGFIHAAEALGDVCAHLTVGMHVVTRHALVEALAALAVDDVELRRSLPLGLDLDDRATLADELRATVAALVAYAEETEPEPVVEHLRETPRVDVAPRTDRAARTGRRRPRPSTPAMRVRLREGLAARLDASDGVADARAPDGHACARRPVSRRARDASRRRRAHRRLRFPVSPARSKSLVRTLLRESVVVPVGG